MAKTVGPGGVTWGWPEGSDHWGDEMDANLQKLDAITHTQRTLEDFGGVGDNATDNTDALALAVADGAVVIPDGKFRISTEIPANTRGVPVTGPGSLMVPVSQEVPSLGYHRYPFVEDEGKAWFGMEYLYPLHKAWKDVSIPAIYLTGDSTIYGTGITEEFAKPENLLLTSIRQRGFEATVTNKAVPSTTTLDFDSQMSNAEIDAATAVLVGFGINDSFAPPSVIPVVENGIIVNGAPTHASLDAFIAAYRAILVRIRGRRSELETTIIIKTPNAVSDTSHSRDETQAYAQRRALRKLARDFKCVLIDTPMFVSDVRPNQNINQSDTVGPTGKWSGATQIAPGWMDDPFREAGFYYDPNSFGNAVHPLEIANAWIWGVVAECICGPFRWLAKNNWTNNAVTQAQAAWNPDAYGYGATTYRATIGNGWPVDGIVHTIKDTTGNGIQIVYGYTESVPNINFRTAVNATSWSGWGVDYPSIRSKVLTGTTESSQGGVVSVAHGLTASKILSVQAVIEHTTGAFVPNGYTYAAGYDASVSWDATTILIANSPTNSANILAKPVKIIVNYGA